MQFGTNLQLLRRRKGLTQEQLAQQLCVSRQTVSKWESGQIPELGKLLELADFFSCKLDDLLRQDMSVSDRPLRIVQVAPFSMARYVMISSHAHSDVRSYLENWANRSGLLEFSEKPPVFLSWGFPYISPEQKNRFGLQGAAAACILPEGFQPRCGGPALQQQQEACTYAVLTIIEPNGREESQISRAIQSLLEALREAGIPKAAMEGCLPSFELRYEQDGIPYADIFVQCKFEGNTEIVTF